MICVAGGKECRKIGGTITKARNLFKALNKKGIVIKGDFEDEWYIYEQPVTLPIIGNVPYYILGGNKEHKKSYVYTNTILEWAKKQETRPFDSLYLGRKLEDLKEEMMLPQLDVEPPTEAFGFKLEFPLWRYNRINDFTLYSPDRKVMQEIIPLSARNIHHK